MFVFFFFFKQKTAYEMRISDWSSDVCSSDLLLYLPAVLVLLAPTLGHAASCSDNVDVNATVLANGFAADLANTRQFSSQIDAANVATLQLAWADVADGITERRGAPAVTQQAVFYSAGRQIVAANRQSGCRY